MEKQNDFFEEYVSINNLEHYFLHYPTESDFLVLFLHGGPGQSESYLAYKTVSKNRNYSLVFYDQRGSGKTNLKDASQEKVTLKILISDLDKIIDYLKSKYHQKKIIILGHSWGSILGLEYSKLFPEKISAYVGMGQVINFRQGEKVGFEYCYKLANQKDKKKLLKLGNYPNQLQKKMLWQNVINFGDSNEIRYLRIQRRNFFYVKDFSKKPGILLERFKRKYCSLKKKHLTHGLSH